MKTLRFALIGAGYWARYQLAAWRELPGAECVAICDCVRDKAQRLASTFGVPSVYDDLATLLANEQLDFIDIVTRVETHAALVELAAAHRVPAVICQKPMTPTVAEAWRIVETCRQAGVAFFIQENWRWQSPIRQVWRELTAGGIGKPFRARIAVRTGYPVFANQPYLRDEPQLILADLGCHLLDAARFLFGEPNRLYCQTNSVQPGIRGEDAATVVMCMGGGKTVTCEMSYAGNPVDPECFPQTLMYVEGEKGVLELAPDYWIRIATADGIHLQRCPPKSYAWADPALAVVHASIVDCHANLLQALRDGTLPETHAADYLRTFRLVDDAYRSAREGVAIKYD